LPSISSHPADVNEGAKGDTLLRCDLDVEPADIAVYEWDDVKFDDNLPNFPMFREWLIPADLINRQGKVSLVHRWDRVGGVKLLRRLLLSRHFCPPLLFGSSHFTPCRALTWRFFRAVVFDSMAGSGRPRLSGTLQGFDSGVQSVTFCYQEA